MIIVICSQQNGFRRGGVHHSQGNNFYPEDHFTEKALALLQEEPKLIVQTGLEPTGPGLMSVDELCEALEKAEVEFSKDEPREHLVKMLKNAMATGKADGEENELIKAARQAIENGDTISSGAPDIKAMEEILGKNVSAASRDFAWSAIQAEG